MSDIIKISDCGGLTPLSVRETCLAGQSADMSAHSK